MEKILHAAEIHRRISGKFIWIIAYRWRFVSFTMETRRHVPCATPMFVHRQDSYTTTRASYTRTLYTTHSHSLRHVNMRVYITRLIYIQCKTYYIVDWVPLLQLRHVVVVEILFFECTHLSPSCFFSLFQYIFVSLFSLEYMYFIACSVWRHFCFNTIRLSPFAIRHSPIPIKIRKLQCIFKTCSLFRSQPTLASTM